MNRWEVRRGNVETYLSHHRIVSLTHGSSGFWNCCRSTSYIEERSTSSSVIPHVSMALNATYTYTERSEMKIESDDARSHLYDCIADRRRFDRAHAVNRSVAPFFALLCACCVTFAWAEEDVPIRLGIPVSNCPQRWGRTGLHEQRPTEKTLRGRSVH